jgi:starch phosphorylase
VREYTEEYYLPALSAYEDRAAKKGALGAQIVGWQKTLARDWSGIRFGDLRMTMAEQKYEFEVPVFLDEIDPEVVRVELYAEGDGNVPPVRHTMTRVRPLPGPITGYIYGASVPATRPASDYTARVVPRFPKAKVPLEAQHILWQK